MIRRILGGLKGRRCPPIVIMSFNRPAYLRQVLQSLTAQTQPVDRREVHLFQDGATSPIDGERHAEDADIDACVELFRAHFPHGKVWRSDHNIGTAMNFRRAEEQVFADPRNEVAYYFEDDLVLHPRYLELMDRLADMTETHNPPVGYFTVHGNLRLSDQDQIRRRHEIELMGHNWAFGLRRSHWLRMQPLLARYYVLIEAHSYRDLPSPRVIAEMKKLGVDANVASQDDMKKAITYALGAVALGTVQVASRYIGAEGLHMSPANFDAMGYDKVGWLEPLTDRFELLRPDQLGKLLERDRKAREERWEMVQRDLVDETDNASHMEHTMRWLVGEKPEAPVSSKDDPA